MRNLALSFGLILALSGCTPAQAQIGTKVGAGLGFCALGASLAAALAGSFGPEDAYQVVECAHNALGPVLESSADPASQALRRLDQAYVTFITYPDEANRRRLRAAAAGCDELIEQ